MASSLNSFVSSVQKASVENNLDRVIELVRKTVGELLARQASSLDTSVLPQLALPHHTIPVLGALVAKLTHATPTLDAFDATMTQFDDFLLQCNHEHVRLVPDLLCEAGHSAKRQAIAFERCGRVISFLQSSIDLLMSSPDQLTPLHADLCYLCLHTRRLRPALALLGADVNSVIKLPDSADSTRHFLAYYYYGAMLYMLAEKYDRALFFLEILITTPASAVSYIMLEGYKKYVFLSLLVNGKTQPLPRYTSTVVTRFIKPLCQPYDQIANAVGSGAFERARTLVHGKHRETLQADENYGLAKRVLTSIHRRSIQRLTQTFVTLSLSDVANRCDLPNAAVAEACILKMIAGGEMHARIDQSSAGGTVHFLDAPEMPEASLRLLGERITAAQGAEAHIRGLDETLAKSTDYLKKQSGHKGAGGMLLDDEGLGRDAMAAYDFADPM